MTTRWCAAFYSQFLFLTIFFYRADVSLIIDQSARNLPMRYQIIPENSGIIREAAKKFFYKWSDH